jgi:hypothetical protein
MDELTTTNGKIDRQHVNLRDEVACLYWETRLGAERHDIRAAIEAVGEAPGEVERWLRDAHKSHIRPEVQRAPGMSTA